MSAPGAGRFRVYGRRSAAVVGLYAVMIGLLLYFAATGTGLGASPVPSLLLAVIAGFFLARYLLTQYVLDDSSLLAWRPIGSRRIELETVRRIEFANLRDLGPIGLMANWGYRGRMWSPILGNFDAIYTDSRGLLVTAGAHPLFLSPPDPAGFARELSRRVRSYSGPLDVDVGASEADSPAQRSSGF